MPWLLEVALGIALTRRYGFPLASVAVAVAVVAVGSAVAGSAGLAFAAFV